MTNLVGWLKLRCTRLITLAWLVIPLSSASWASQFDDAVASYQRGDHETAVHLLEPLANQGMPEAELSLGLLYILGRIGPPDLTIAERWLGKAADQNFPPAEFALGLVYQTRAALWGPPSPAHQTPATYHSLQMRWYNSPDRAVMAQWYDKARKWYARAADQGLAAAQFRLGRMYATGQATQQFERNRAMSWYRKAAEQGSPEAEIALADIYRLDGFPVPRDVTQARRLYEQAAASDADAQTTLAQKYEFGDGDLFPRDHVLAARWYLKAAEQGYPPAEWKIAQMYSIGDGVPTDKAIAAHWYHERDEQPADVRRAIAQFLCNRLDLNLEPKCLVAWLPERVSALQRKY